MSGTSSKAPKTISEALLNHQTELTTVGERILDGDKAGSAAALLGLVASASSGVPAIGALVDAAAQKAFASTATARLLAEAERLDREDAAHEAEESFKTSLADRIEVLLGQALVQIIRSQHSTAEQDRSALVEALGGIREDLASFRSSFSKEVRTQNDLPPEGESGQRPPTPAGSAVSIGTLTVQTGGTGIQDSSSGADDRTTPLVAVRHLSVLENAVGLRITARSRSLAWIETAEVKGVGVQLSDQE